MLRSRELLRSLVRERRAPEVEMLKLGLRELFETIEMPLVDVLAELEYNGITVDPDELERQRAALERSV